VDGDLLAEISGEPIPMLRAWDAPGHGFLSRVGGVSAGAYATLNLARWVGDNPAAVEENWRRVRPVLAEARLIARVNQVHGRTVRIVTRANAADCPRADGMVTVAPGVALAIFTADCVPILMHDRRRRIVGALHAGWRGIVAGIVAEGVAAMRSLGASALDIRAALWPSIGPCCFEVDASLAGQFARELPGAAARIRGGCPGKAYLDLRGIVRDELARAGVADGDVIDVGPCTRCAADRFFSRRAAGATATGLQMSFIGLPP
jgi:YfiH family protein